MKDKEGSILYVGKARILRNRVKQYFNKNVKTTRIEKMVSLVDHFEYIVTDTEAEALILECNLIKKNMPKFNVLLKDDKTYPYIKINMKEDYPNIYITRQIKNDGAKYFGPYANSGATKEMLDFIKEKFKVRQCKIFKSNTRACLNYHIKRCLAPCMGYISKEEYIEQIKEIIMLLDGKTQEIIKKIDFDIKRLAEKQEYEKAAVLRDKKQAIISISEKQKVSNINENTIDVIGMAKNSLLVCIEIFFIRNSKMIGKENYFFENIQEETNKEILSMFVKQYYINKIDLPAKIMMKEEIEDKETIENILFEKQNKKVEFKIPKRGEKIRFIEMAEKNAQNALDNKNSNEDNILKVLKQDLKLKDLPTKIECYDISNISGTFIVAGMCVAKNGIMQKNLSRRFKIKTVMNQDDPKCIEEVLTRRLKHSIRGENEGFGNLPSLILIDGGITQLNFAKSSLAKYNLQIPIFGMVKNDKHKTKAVINLNKEEMVLSKESLNFVTNLQDNVHKVAIEYHRKIRDKEITKSKLIDIEGIGEKKERELLKKFGSVKRIKEASVEDIAEIKGINLKIAEKIKKVLQ